MDIAIIYASHGGNTEEVAQQIEETLRASGHSTTCINVYSQRILPELQSKDLVFFGAFTWGTDGVIPDAMLNYMRKIIKEEPVELPPVAVFGTGEKQWGRNYCRAVDAMVYHFSKVTRVIGSLKIEQAPRGNQKHLTPEFTNRVLEELNNATTESKDI